MSKPSSGLQRAAAALAAADSVAHVVFLGLFGWRAATGGILGKYLNLVCAALAFVGLALGVVGWLLLKHAPGKTLKGLGVWGVGLSTALAGLLLLAAPRTG